MSIEIKSYLIYKLLNSLFLGLSVGVVMSIYAPLSPSVYSLGGIALAIGMMGLALLYEKILTIKWFAISTILVESIMLIVVLIFLLIKFDYMTSLMIYIGYQATFVFGGYLVRAETILLNNSKILKNIDILKQIGTLFGMASSYIFYKIYGQQSNIEQVYDMHYLLLIVQLTVVYFAIKSFASKISN